MDTHKAVHQRYRQPYPSERTSTNDTARGDIQYRDVVFVYKVSFLEGAMGGTKEIWETKPRPLRCSFQDHALSSEHTDPNNAGSRFSRLFTREPNALGYHDKVIFRGVEWMIEKVLPRFDNFTGDYHHTECKLSFLIDTKKPLKEA